MFFACRTSHCLRRGGAAWHFPTFGKYDLVAEQGRRKHVEDCRVYMNSAMADLVAANLQQADKDSLSSAPKVWLAVLAGRGLGFWAVSVHVSASGCRVLNSAAANNSKKISMCALPFRCDSCRVVCVLFVFRSVVIRFCGCVLFCGCVCVYGCGSRGFLGVVGSLARLFWIL